MKYFKLFLFILVTGVTLFAQQDPMGSMSIEYGPYDIIGTARSSTEQRFVSIEYYEQVVQPVESAHFAARNGEYEKAISLFRESLKKDSTYVFAHNGMGNAYLKLGDLTRAEYYFRKAMQFGSNYAFPYNNLANLYMLQDRRSEALPLLLTALNLDPNSAYVYYNVGNYYLHEGNNAVAQSYYLKALKLDKDLCDARYNLALTYWRQNRPAMAVSEYEKTVKTCPGHEKAVLNLAAYYLQSRQPDKALMLYRQALLINPQSEIYLAMGHALYNQNYYKDAIKAYREAIALDSANIRAKYYLALSYYEQDMLFSTHEILKQMLEQDPDHEGAKELQNKIGL